MLKIIIERTEEKTTQTKTTHKGGQGDTVKPYFDIIGGKSIIEQLELEIQK